MISKVEQVLEGYKEDQREAAGLLDRFHLESLELLPILEHVSGVGAEERGTVRSHVSIPDQEKVRAMERLLMLMRDLPDTVNVVIQDHTDRIEIVINGEVRDHERQEAPRFAKDILRRRISVKEGSKTLTCPMCASVIEPQKGELWGLWCPTCNIRLVMG
jgi:hypothetical protein